MWAICAADASVLDRFNTKAEAEQELRDGGYPEGSYVAEVPDPDPYGD